MKRLVLLSFVLMAGMFAWAEQDAAAPVARVLIGCEKGIATQESLSVEHSKVKLTKLEPLGDRPFHYVLVFDTSSSVQKLGTGAHSISAALLHTLTRTGKDQGSLVTFATGTASAHGTTTNADDILDSLKKTPIGGGTAMYDGIFAGIAKLDEMGGDFPRFLFLVSDGQDNQSRHTRAQAIEALLASHTHLIAITPGESTRGGAVLSSLAEASGGLMLQMTPDKKEPDVIRHNHKEMETLSHLFQNWYWLELEVPRDSERMISLEIKDKNTQTKCTVVAPGKLALSGDR